MKKTHACLAAAVAALITTSAGAAAAQDMDVAFNAAVTSDYVFRGFSQTDEEPALQLGADLTYGGWYAGVWGSNVDFGDDTDAEIDVYGGYRAELGGAALDFGIIGYGYVNEPSSVDYNYVELKAAASRAVGPVTAGLALYYSPDFFGVDGEAFYTEANLAVSPADGWTVSAAVGKQVLDLSADYATWNAGVAWALTDNLVADVRYYDTDVDGVAIADERVVGTIKVLF